MRFALARRGRRNPLQRQPEPLLEREIVGQPRLIVGRERDQQRAVLA